MPAFDKEDADSIARFAERLRGLSLRQALTAQRRESELDGSVKACGKGHLGNLVQFAYFGVPVNSKSEADFHLAGLELKVTPLKHTKKGLRSKERIVLNLIRWTNLAAEKSLETSSFYEKNKRLLILFYIYEKGKPIEDLKFFAVKDWTIPKDDLTIVRADWEHIRNAARDNTAHLLSEGHTFYLGACTKGTGDVRDQRQVDGSIARQRAFSLKSSYVNRMLEEMAASKIKSIAAHAIFRDGQTFEDWVVEKFQRYRGKSLASLASTFKTSEKAKHAFNLAAKAIAKHILGVEPGEEIAEFERADIQIKTIRLTRKGTLKESMSFRQIRYQDIVDEEWEDSMFHEDLSQRFFFVVFQDDAQGTPRLRNVKFWSVPDGDMYEIKTVWEDTRDNVAKGRYDRFIGMKDHEIAHVRPKARNAADKAETREGVLQPKKSFWLNRGYIVKQLD